MKHPVLDLYESLKPFLDKKVKLMYYSEDENKYFEEKPENIKVTPVIWILLDDDSEEPDVIEISWDPIEWEFKVSLGQDPDLSIDYYIPNVKPNLFAEVIVEESYIDLYKKDFKEFEKLGWKIDGVTISAEEGQRFSLVIDLYKEIEKEEE